MASGLDEAVEINHIMRWGSRNNGLLKGREAIIAVDVGVCPRSLGIGLIGGAPNYLLGITQFRVRVLEDLLPDVRSRLQIRGVVGI